MLKNLLIAINSGYAHSCLAVRQLSDRSGIPFVEFNINMQTDDVLARIMDYDVLWFSCYIWNISYIYNLIDDIKRIDSSKIVVLGGPSVSFNGQTIIKRHRCVDYIVCGEGEDIILPLAECIEKGASVQIPGVLFIEDGEVCGSSEYQLARRLKCFPYNGDIVYFESSRGCPFLCSYCLSGFVKGGVRYYDLEEVKNTLTLLSKKGIRVVKFVDRTFNANEAWASSILEHLLTLESETIWHFEISGDLLTDKLIDLLNRGNFQVEIGIQSFNEKSLRAVNRYCNLNKLCENVKKLKIHKHVDLIAGMPFEDKESFICSFNRAFALQADMLQLGFLKVLPGSKLRNDKSVTFSERPPYKVLKTDWISHKELCELEQVEKMLDIYYNRGRFKLSLEYLLELQPSPYHLFERLACNMGERVYEPSGYKWAAENMFSTFKNDVDENLLMELMRCDYYLSKAKGNTPEFLTSIKYNVKEIRKQTGIEKSEPFFVTKVNYLSREKINCAVLINTGRIIPLKGVL